MTCHTWLCKVDAPHSTYHLALSVVHRAYRSFAPPFGGQVGQWWGVSPGGRLSASQCTIGGAFLLAGDGNGHHDTCDRMKGSLTSLLSAPTVRIKCAKGEKSTIFAINSAKVLKSRVVFILQPASLSISRFCWLLREGGKCSTYRVI